MRARTVQDLIDHLATVEDKSRSVMVAGDGPLEGVEILGVDGPWSASGQVILWSPEKHRKAGHPGTWEWLARRRA